MTYFVSNNKFNIETYWTSFVIPTLLSGIAGRPCVLMYKARGHVMKDHLVEI